MISDDKLIGWLVFFRHQSEHNASRVYVPVIVSEALVAKGWMTVDAEADWEGDRPSKFTESGLAMSDLYAMDYGIDPLYEESEA